MSLPHFVSSTFEYNDIGHFVKGFNQENRLIRLIHFTQVQLIHLKSEAIFVTTQKLTIIRIQKLFLLL